MISGVVKSASAHGLVPPRVVEVSMNVGVAPRHVRVPEQAVQNVVEASSALRRRGGPHDARVLPALLLVASLVGCGDPGTRDVGPEDAQGTVRQFVVALEELASEERDSARHVYRARDRASGQTYPSDWSSRPGFLERVSEVRALDTLRRSDVVVLCDLHRSPRAAAESGRLLQASAARTSGMERAVFLEQPPAEADERLADLIEGAGRNDWSEVRELLSEYIPFPLAGVLSLLRDAAQTRARVHGARSRLVGRVVLGAGVEDRFRSPLNPAGRWVGSETAFPGSRDDVLEAGTVATFDRVVGWTAEHRVNRQAWVLIGRAHVFGEDGLARRLRMRGLQVAVVRPDTPIVDLSLFSQGGDVALDSWQLIDGEVLRPPVARQDVLDSLAHLRSSRVFDREQR